MRRSLKKVPRIVLVVILMGAFGFLREPFEEKARDELVEAEMIIPPPGITAMESLSQSVLMGMLGGLRGLIAFGFELRAFGNFSDKDWEALRENYLVITMLEPGNEEHWIAATWHLGINATANMEVEEALPKFERERRFREYAFQAIEFAERGAEQNPDSWRILTQLAEVYREKLKDNCAAAEVYGRAMDIEGAPSFTRRFHGYFLARCPGNEEDAYKYLTSLYHEGEEQRLPTLIKEIKNLEEKLKKPFILRIPDPDPDLELQKMRKSRNGRMPGQISIP